MDIYTWQSVCNGDTKSRPVGCNGNICHWPVVLNGHLYLGQSVCNGDTKSRPVGVQWHMHWPVGLNGHLLLASQSVMLTKIPAIGVQWQIMPLASRFERTFYLGSQSVM